MNRKVNKIWKSLISFSLTLLLLTSCGIPSSARTTEVTHQSTYQAEQTNINQAESLQQSQKLFPAFPYYYSLLSQENKKVYEEIYQAFVACKRNVLLSVQTEEQISYVCEAVLLDHPELFYVNSYTYTIYNRNNTFLYYFSGNYTYTPEEIAVKKQQIKYYTNTLFSLITEDMNDYDKVKYLYETIILNTEYKEQALDNQNILSVFLQHESVCSGYAKSFQYSCNLLGIPCICVNGTAGEPHMWNLVNLYGNWYYVDTTWGDSKTTEALKISPIDYSYLCITQEELTRTHQIDKTYPLPLATQDTYNYYKQEALFLENSDNDSLFEALKAPKEIPGQGYLLTIKAKDKLVFEEIHQKLIEGQDIFLYLPEGCEVYYSGNENLYTYHFYFSPE